MDDQLDDYGAAYPGFLILNPKLLSRVSTAVKMWIYAHECGHQFRGPDEETADCFAVQRGRRQGWLTPEGLEEVCKFIAPAKGDSMHFQGSHRCEVMRQCYADPGHPLRLLACACVEPIPAVPIARIIGRFTRFRLLRPPPMGLLDYTIRILGLSETILKWQGAITQLGAERREKVAQYAEQIAATLARAAAAFAALEKDPAKPGPAGRPSASSAASPATSRTSSRPWKITLTGASLPALKGGWSYWRKRSRCARPPARRMPSVSSACSRPKATSGPWPMD